MKWIAMAPFELKLSQNGFCPHDASFDSSPGALGAQIRAKIILNSRSTTLAAAMLTLNSALHMFRCAFEMSAPILS